jgi:hypothetical protein
MKFHVGRCKICKCELRLQIADGYDAEHDPSKLIRMATCDRCFDLRARQIRLEDAIKVVCHNLVHVAMSGDGKFRAKELLLKLTQRFSQWCADMLNRQHAANSVSLAEKILTHPPGWWRCLRDFENEANES